MEENVTKSKFKFPTETVELPSKGLIYPKDNPLSSGKIEMKYMTAKEEDILTNANYLQKGIVLDKLLESLIVSKINYSDLITGDKNALLIAARVLGYGKDYEFTYGGENTTKNIEKGEEVLDYHDFCLHIRTHIIISTWIEDRETTNTGDTCDHNTWI